MKVTQFRNTSSYFGGLKQRSLSTKSTEVVRPIRPCKAVKTENACVRAVYLSLVLALSSFMSHD